MQSVAATSSIMPLSHSARSVITTDMIKEIAIIDTFLLVAIINAVRQNPKYIDMTFYGHVEA